MRTRAVYLLLLITVCVAGMAAALLAWGLTPNVPLALVVLAPLALAGGTLNTVLNSALTKAVHPGEVGGTLSLSTALQGLSGVVAPTLGGLMLQSVGTWPIGALGALIMVWLASFVWRYEVRSKAHYLARTVESPSDDLG